MKKYEDLNIDDLDLLKEVNNICSGHAASELSKMLAKEVRISIPSMRLLDYQVAQSEIGDEEKVVGGVMLQLCGEMQGIVLFLYDLAFANDVLEPLMLDRVSAFDEMSEDHISALSEIGNIIVGSYASSLSQLTGCRVDISVPSTTVNMLGAIISVPMAYYGYETNKLLYSNTEFIINGQKHSNWLMLIPNVASMNKMIETIGG